MDDDVLIRFRLVGDEAKALRKLSAEEMRDPRDQTRFLVRHELERRGFLQTESTSTPARDQAAQR